MASDMGAILYQYNYDGNMDIMYKILNELSARGASPDIFKDIGIGDALVTIFEMKRVLISLQSKTDNDSMRVKQILLSAMICLDDNDEVLNTSTLYGISETYRSIRRQIIMNKDMFNDGRSHCLYNEETIEEKTRIVYEQEVYDHIDEHLKQTTSPDLNKYKRMQIFAKDLNKKMPHPHHRHDGLFKVMYPDWKSKATHDLNRNNLPAQTIFDKYRKKQHSYIKKRDKDAGLQWQKYEICLIIHAQSSTTAYSSMSKSQYYYHVFTF